MNLKSIQDHTWGFAAIAGCLLFIAPIIHAGPFIPAPNPIIPRPALGAPAAARVHPGKEYSHELDKNGTTGAYDAQQNIMWDGQGGVADSFDYDGIDDPRATEPNAQVDAIANGRDTLYDAVVNNKTAILFSERTGPNTQGAGLDTAYPVYYETTSGNIGGWATAAQVDQHGVVNLDGLEVWGPTSPADAPVLRLNDPTTGGADGVDDANKYSLFDDFSSGFSVYNMDGSSYIPHSLLYAEVHPFLLNELGIDLLEENVDLDALMVSDNYFAFNVFDVGDEILFSLRPDSTTGLVGDLVMRWVNGTGISWLDHGDHLWVDGWNGVNIDALEAAGTTPEPSTLLLMSLGVVGFLFAGHRRGRA